MNSEDLKNDNVYFTEKRHNVTLFDFSMVEAEMELIYTAMNREHYQYFILLSGQCYPLLSGDKIFEYLVKSYPEPFIEVISPEIVKKFDRQFRYTHVMKKFRTNSFSFISSQRKGKSIYPYKYIPEGIVYIATVIAT